MSTPMINACVICHKKKVKCDLANRRPCSNCTRTGKECIMYSRKRKRYTNSLSPRESAEPQLSQSHNHQDSTPSHPVHKYNSRPATDGIEAYRARDRYLGKHVSFDEAIASRYQKDQGSRLSSSDLQLLTHQSAFQLPPKPMQDEYISAYMKYCSTWTPIVEPSWLRGPSVSYLLLHSILLAASRVTKQPNAHWTSADLYRRAKLLFFFGHEQDPLISIVSAVLLHWYNPVGPETISTDTSGFWLRTAESIAFQVGLHKEPARHDKNRALRRRLWWTLVVRDCIISAGVGRPRTINLSDSDVLPPTLYDFDVEESSTNPRLFLVYASICQLLGDIVEGCLRPQQQSAHQATLENALYRWVKQDIQNVICSTSGRYSLEVSQILVTYFANLIILDRSPTSDGVPSARSFMASSFISGIYKEFLANDELCRLGPVFTFYALCAGLVVIPAIQFPALRDTASEELLVLTDSLQILSRQWGSAFGALRALHKLGSEAKHQLLRQDPIPVLKDDMAPFFEGFMPFLCRQWNLFLPGASNPTMKEPQVPDNTNTEAVSEPSFSSSLDPGATAAEAESGTFQEGFDLLSGNWEGVRFDWSGSWLLEDGLAQLNGFLYDN